MVSPEDQTGSRSASLYEGIEELRQAQIRLRYSAQMAAAFGASPYAPPAEMQRATDEIGAMVGRYYFAPHHPTTVIERGTDDESGKEYWLRGYNLDLGRLSWVFRVAPKANPRRTLLMGIEEIESIE